MATVPSWIPGAVQWLRSEAQDERSLKPSTQQGINTANLLELESFLGVLANLGQLPLQSKQVATLCCQWVAARLQVLNGEDPEHQIDPEVVEQAYRFLEEAELGDASAHMLQILASQESADSMETLAELLHDSSPSHWQQAAVGLAPLWKANANRLDLFFEAVGDEFFHPVAMTVLLDLANYSVREKKLNTHPWQKHLSRLTDLMRSVVRRLKQLERSPAEFGDSVEEVQTVLNDSLALAVSLADALGLTRDPSAKEVLHEALDLSHRRLQSEVAGALASLGDSDGAERLIQLAADPSSRLRAITYLEELGLEEGLDETLLSPQAKAESELANWLALPEQFGIPPSKMEFVAARTQYWPSYEAPQECFLFRFTYMLESGPFTNVGIAGPFTHAFGVDLNPLPEDDIYAIFAGYQAEHEDIYEVPINELNASQKIELDRLENAFRDRGFQVKRAIALTFLLGEIALIALIEAPDEANADADYCAVGDANDFLYHRVAEQPPGLAPDILLCMYRGRKLLRAFNH